MGICWRSVEVTNMNQTLQDRGIQVGKVQLYKIVQEEPYYTFVPTGPNDEVSIVLVPNFLLEMSEEGGSGEGIPPGPPREGHLVIHENVNPWCAA